MDNSIITIIIILIFTLIPDILWEKMQMDKELKPNFTSAIGGAELIISVVCIFIQHYIPYKEPYCTLLQIPWAGFVSIMAYWSLYQNEYKCPDKLTQKQHYTVRCTLVVSLLVALLLVKIIEYINVPYLSIWLATQEGEQMLFTRKELLVSTIVSVVSTTILVGKYERLALKKHPKPHQIPNIQERR